MSQDKTRRLAQPTMVQAKEFLAEMGRRFRGKVVDKSSAVEMKVVAAIFDAIRAFGAKVPESAEFMEHYATTLGPLVYMPPTWTPDVLIDVGTHEFTHVDQFWNGEFDGDVGFGGGASFAYLYLVEEEARVRAEQRAMRSQWELRHLAFGDDLPPPRQLAMILERGYNLSPKAVKLAEDLAEAWLTEVFYGVVATPTGSVAIDLVRGMGLAG